MRNNTILKVGDKITITGPEGATLNITKSSSNLTGRPTLFAYTLVAKDFVNGRAIITAQASRSGFVDSDSVSLTYRPQLRIPTASAGNNAIHKVGDKITFRSPDAGNVVVTTGSKPKDVSKKSPHTYLPQLRVISTSA